MASEEINRAFVENRRKAEIFRKGLVTRVDNAHNPPLAWVSDGAQTRRMPSTQAGLAVGDVVHYVEQSDPFVFGKVNPTTEGGGVPNIWCCTSLRDGATTWRSATGDTRTIEPALAETVANGGLIAGPYSAVGIVQIYAEHNEVDEGFNYPTAVGYSLTVDMSAWWEPPTPWHYTPHLYESGFSVALLPTGWWDGATNPAVPTFSDGASDPSVNGIPVDAAALALVGKTGIGYGRLRFRIDYTVATGATEIFLWDDRRNPFQQWRSIGTATFGAGVTPTSYVDWNRDLWLFGVPSGLRPLARTVLHGIEYEIEHSTTSTVIVFASEHLDAQIEPYQPFRRKAGTWKLPGRGVIDSNNQLFGLQSFSGSAAAAPRGAPLTVTGETGGDANGNDALTPPFPALFTDGDALTDPVMAVSTTWDPGRIRIIEGVQPGDPFPGIEFSDAADDTNDPQTFEYAAHIWAIADRATATALDENGWPLNWWPFGTLTT